MHDGDVKDNVCCLVKMLCGCGASECSGMRWQAIHFSSCNVSKHSPCQGCAPECYFGRKLRILNVLSLTGNLHGHDAYHLPGYLFTNLVKT